MQIGTVSRLRFCGRSWRFEIDFWRNIVRFRKSYICSTELDVQGTNFSFTQFNRIQNHLFGHWIEIGWFACSGIVGSDYFCSGKHDSDCWETGETRYHRQESKISREDQRVEQHWLCSIKRPVFTSRSFVACVWGFTRGYWSFLLLGLEKKWYGTHVCKFNGEWDKILEGMIWCDAQLCRKRTFFIPWYQRIRKRRMKKQRKRKWIFSLQRRCETIELILRTIISVNQFSIYGAVADLCKELARDSFCAGKPAVNENLGSMVIPTKFPDANLISQTDGQGNLLREYEQTFVKLPEQ